MRSQRVKALVGALVVLMVFAMPGGVADQDSFIVFEFQQLRFDFFPEGLPKASEDDPDGSALEIHVVNVSVLGFDASDLRYCIDGWGPPYCPFAAPAGNGDAQASVEEVQKFAELATSAAFAIQEVRNLTNIVQNNIKIDGEASARPRVTAIRFEGAEGPVDSYDTIRAFVDVEARYANDADAKRHDVVLRNLEFKDRGFAYEQVLWEAKADKSTWIFQVEDTTPAAAQSKLGRSGWFSDQGTFEAFTADSLTFVLEREGRAEGKSAGPGFMLLIAGAMAALVFHRRTT